MPVLLDRTGVAPLDITFRINAREHHVETLALRPHPGDELRHLVEPRRADVGAMGVAKKQQRRLAGKDGLVNRPAILVDERKRAAEICRLLLVSAGLQIVDLRLRAVENFRRLTLRLLGALARIAQLVDRDGGGGLHEQQAERPATERPADISAHVESEHRTDAGNSRHDRIQRPDPVPGEPSAGERRLPADHRQEHAEGTRAARHLERGKARGQPTALGPEDCHEKWHKVADAETQ